jgi:hypothetical protein
VSSPSRIVRLPLVAMAAVLAALTLVALILATDSRFSSWGWWRYGFFAIPLVVAAYYLSQYRLLPYEPWHFFPPQPEAPVAPSTQSAPEPPAAGVASPPEPAAPGLAAGPASEPSSSLASSAQGETGAAPADALSPGDNEPFEDPVEEADRLAQEEARKSARTAPDGVDRGSGPE